MAVRNEKVYRALLSAIIGSDLTVRDIRWLVGELSLNGEFMNKVQEGLWRLADDLEMKFSRNYISTHEVGYPPHAGLISEMIYEHVVSKKISKSELRSILGQLDKEWDWVGDSKKRTLREIINKFVDESQPSQVVNLMDSLGLRSEEDSYLAGIDKKTKRP